MRHLSGRRIVTWAALALFALALAACGGRVNKELLVQASNIPPSFDVTLIADKDNQFDYDPSGGTNGAPLTEEDLRSALRYRKEQNLPCETIIVKRGEKALTLCMPLTRKRRDDESQATDAPSEEQTYTTFVHKARWFVVSQTFGNELGPVTIPEWEAARALTTLGIECIPFDKTDGNCQGFARGRQIAINPVAQLPHKTRFHEMAHVLLHTSEGDFTDTEQTPRNLRELEAEAVALLCCEALNLEGADYCRGYIQNWLSPAIGYNADAIPEKSAQKIFRAADQILRAGRRTKEQSAEFAN